MSVWWSISLAAVGILGIYLAGRQNLWGWAVGVGAQLLWIVYAIVTGQWGFILSALAYGWVYGLNWWKWARARRSILATGRARYPRTQGRTDARGQDA